MKVVQSIHVLAHRLAASPGYDDVSDSSSCAFITGPSVVWISLYLVFACDQDIVEYQHRQCFHLLSRTLYDTYIISLSSSICTSAVLP